MIYRDPAHQAFYEQAVVTEQAENDPSRKALFYCLGLTEATRAHINDLYDFRKHIIKESGLRGRWQTRETRKVCNLAYNLYNGFHGRSGCYLVDYTPWRLFDTDLRPYFYQAIDIRYEGTLNTDISPMPGNKVFRADFLKKYQLRFPPRRLWEDDVFMFSAFICADRVSIVKDAYQHYFQHNDSVSHLFSREHIDAFLLSFVEIRSALRQDSKWEEYQNEFYSYMDRGLNSLLDVMFTRVQQVSAQRAYLTLLINGLIDAFSIEELLTHIDPKRIQRVWL